MLKLYRTLALPLHYIAEEEFGIRWMIPVAPLGPSNRKRWYVTSEIIPSLAARITSSAFTNRQRRLEPLVLCLGALECAC